MDNGKDFIKTFKKITLWVIFITLICVIALQQYKIQKYKESEDEWVALSQLWRERLDTCMNRNERIYEQLYQFQDIRIQQLKEEKAKKNVKK
jgi:hypothetical protein